MLRVDEKNLKECMVPNVCGIILTTNHKTDGLHLPADDRRHYVAWSEKTKEDFEEDYWKRRWTWYEKEGGYGHVAAYLASYELSTFNPKAPRRRRRHGWRLWSPGMPPSPPSDQIDPDGRLRYNLILSGRAKKNWKSADLILAALFALLANDSPGGNQVYLFANDEGQAADDLQLAKKLVEANPILAERLVPRQKSIDRRDGRGFMLILPAQDVAGPLRGFGPPTRADHGPHRARGVRPPIPGTVHVADVDISGGSLDDAVLAIGHCGPDGRVIVDRVLNQGPPPPFDPRKAITRFVEVLREYGITRVRGDRYAGETFRADFRSNGIEYKVCEQTTSQLYEALEPVLNGGRVLLPDVPVLEQQLLGLVWRGGKITHPNGEHDDWATAVAGLVADLAPARQPFRWWWAGESLLNRSVDDIKRNTDEEDAMRREASTAAVAWMVSWRPWR